MRILTKEQLLKEPSGTVYAEYVSEFTNWYTDDLNIIADYDKNQLFAVFNKSEVMKMINCLSWALSGCDGYFDMDEVYRENGVVYRDPEWMPYD